MFLTFLIFFIACSVHSETMGDLSRKKGIYYKKNSNIPFSGNINGNFKGQIHNGKKEGTWVRYYTNGQVFLVSNYKKGKKNGAWITYNNKGHLIEKGQYKNDLEEVNGYVYLKMGNNYKVNLRMEKNRALGLLIIIMDN